MMNRILPKSHVAAAVTVNSDCGEPLFQVVLGHMDANGGRLVQVAAEWSDEVLFQEIVQEDEFRCRDNLQDDLEDSAAGFVDEVDSDIRAENETMMLDAYLSPSEYAELIR